MGPYLYSFRRRILIPIATIKYIKETDEGHMYLITDQDGETFLEERFES